jgi:hypothetical protein
MHRSCEIGFQGILRRAVGGMDCVLHADKDCMRSAIGVADDLRDLSETAKHGIADTASNAPRPEAGMRSVDSLHAPHMHSHLVDHVDGFLRGLIERGYRLRICLEGALSDDQR